MGRRVAPAILAAMLLAMSAAAQEKVDSSVQVSVDGGLWDNGVFDDEEKYIRPSFTLAMQSEELGLEFRGRGLFTRDESNSIDDVDIDGHSRYFDIRGLATWEIGRLSSSRDWWEWLYLPLPGRYNILAGLGYRDTTVIGDHKLVWRFSYAEMGLRHGINLGEYLEIVTEAVGGMMLAGTEDNDDPAGAGHEKLECGFIGEARTALNVHFTKSIALQVGVSYEYTRFRPEESYDYYESHLWSVGLGVIFKF